MATLELGILCQGLEFFFVGGVESLRYHVAEVFAVPGAFALKVVGYVFFYHVCSFLWYSFSALVNIPDCPRRVNGFENGFVLALFGFVFLNIWSGEIGVKFYDTKG